MSFVKSADDLADGLSRAPRDTRDYKLGKDLFSYLKNMVQKWLTPEVDLFACPGNFCLPKFVSRDPHWQAYMVDALKCPLEGVPFCYANPPWPVVHDWLRRLLGNPHLVCMVITPCWDSVVWWPLLAKLQVPSSPALVIRPLWGMFRNCWWGKHAYPGGT